MARELKKGDSFIPINSVDLAVSLWTMDFPFYDPEEPYSYRQIGTTRSLMFLFEDKAPNGFSIADEIKEWPDAEHVTSLPKSIAVCKRTIWERRWLLKELNHPQLYELKHASNIAEVREVRLASTAYALGFEKHNPAVVHGKTVNDSIMLVGKNAPEWLKPYGVNTLDDLEQILQKDIDFVNTPGNELHPVALAIAVYINIVAFLDHFRNEAKPYMRFELPSGRQLWIREGSQRYTDLISQGYFPS